MGKLQIDESWTLFLDRDGVINEKIEDGYVTTWDEFKFKSDVHMSLRFLTKVVGRIIVVTNQQGVGKELMTKDDVNLIHDNMRAEIEENGGKIDRVYFCPDLAEKEPPCRKPEIGMGLWAKRDFPEIDFTKSIMVGDSLSDMRFGLTLGMHCFLITPRKVDPSTGVIRINELFDVLSFITF